MIFGGIDPGVNGALALSEGVELVVWDMPVFERRMPGKKKPRKVLDEAGLLAIFEDWRSVYGVQGVALEQVGGMPGQSGPAAFTFGHGYGAVRMALLALQIPFTPVQPSRWKIDMGVRRATDAKQAKEMSRMRASELLPAHASNWSTKSRADRAEASLLALWASRNHGREIRE